MAALAHLRAEAALRRGDLKSAVTWSSDALERISAESWGVGIGAPLSTLITAHTAMGNLAEAARAVEPVVPEAMWQSRFGLSYWHARGQYYLAIDQVHAALKDFQLCGDMMGEWEMSRPALVPCRTDVAQAY